MSENVFGPAFSAFYDLTYAEKPYAFECDLIEQWIADAGLSRPCTVIDFGCGTGRHSIELARRGHTVTGVDRSRSMLKEAARHAAASSVQLVLEEADLRTWRTAHPADVVLMMFAVLGYQRTDEDLMAALETVSSSLRRGGLFVFDVWYGPAVNVIGPSPRTRTLDTPQGTLTRTSTAELQDGSPIADVTITLELPDESVVTEQHSMRYFDREGLSRALAAVDMELTGLVAFPDVDEPASLDSWNAAGRARRR